jgi:pimeloyl-ACP methyl ester carboxylesterase
VSSPTNSNRLYDFGGQGPVVHLAHANGFPPGTYRPLAQSLTSEFRVVALPSRPLWPGARPESAPTWRPLAGDLIRGLETHGLRAVAGVGHSLGGVLTLWAAIQRPDLFCAVVLVDPVLLLPAWLYFVRVLRALGFGARQPLVQGALRRRHTFSSQEACFAHYRTRSLFARWSDDALWAYVHAGTRPREDGVAELVYPRAWEAHIFAITPTRVWRDVPHLRGVPTLVVRGEDSDTFLPAAQRRVLRLLPEARAVTIPGAGHLAPMERPEAVGAAVRSFLAGIVA